MPGTFTATLETPLSPDPNFPTGYNDQTFRQTFDFTLGWFYQPITSHSPGTDGGIVVTDLSTMDVLKTATLTQMYFGTSFGHPAGSPPSQVIYDVATGNGTNLYMLMDNGLGTGIPGEFCRFTRVDPATLVVTGEYFVSAANIPPQTCVMGQFGVVNTTTTNEIVAYFTNPGLHLGPQIMDGTGMAPIDLGPTPSFGASQNNLAVISGKKLNDGSCDFLMLNSDPTSGGGSVEIWRINVKNRTPPVWQATHSYTAGNIVKPTVGSNTLSFSATTGTSGSTEPTWPTVLGGTVTDGGVTWTAISGLTVTSTLTGTVLITAVVTPSPDLYIAQSNYDVADDTIILWMNATNAPTGPPIWLLSVNYDGSINWSQSLPSDQGVLFSKGQSLLTGSTLMVGAGSDLKVINTTTGAIEVTGSVSAVSASFYRVYDATTQSYFTFAVGSGHFARINFISAASGPFVMRPSR